MATSKLSPAQRAVLERMAASRDQRATFGPILTEWGIAKELYDSGFVECLEVQRDAWIFEITPAGMAALTL